MAIRVASNTVAQQKAVAKQVAQRVAKQSADYDHVQSILLASAERDGVLPVRREEFDALKAEVASLRELIARKAVAPAAKSRAEYYREYRKRPKP